MDTGPCDGAGERLFFEDADLDGYGDDSSAWTGCEAPDGYAEVGGDCDDGDAAVNPGAAESCNGIDDDCDGEADDGVVRTWYDDADQDGYGDPDSATDSCEAVEGAVTVGGDCDDADPEIHPAAVEVCDGVDNDCDGVADQGEEGTWYFDSDGDGVGDSDLSEWTCHPQDGWAAEGGDCDDQDATVYPGAEELCDGVDNDCDGVEDEDFDLDGDGFAGDGCGGADCDDGDASIHPDAVDYCEDGVDSDCDGADVVCGFDGSYDLALADGIYRSHSSGTDLGRLLETGDLDGDGIEDLLAATCFANSWTGGGYVVTKPATGESDVDKAALYLQGDVASGGAGRSVGLADHDGDGVADLLFGMPWAASPGAYIYQGPITAHGSLADAEVRLDGEASSWCGHGSDFADVSGDGLGDAVVGCYAYDAGGLAQSGAVAIHYGPVTADGDLLDDADAILTGSAEGSFAGKVIRAGGDVDGDGLGEILVPTLDDTGVYYSGAVYVVPGGQTGTVDLSSAATAALYGEQAMDVAGMAMAMGDLNGDGAADVVVGSYGNAGGSAAGAAYVVYGPVSGEMNLGDADVIIRGAAANSYAGFGLKAGDLEGDGVDELLVGAPFDDSVVTDGGAAYLFVDLTSGSYTTADADASFMPEGPQDYAGQGVAFGDLDGDGFSEVIVAAPNQNGSGGGGGALYWFQPAL